MALFNATFQPTYVKNKAPILNEHGAQVAINAQGCCQRHPDILLRKKSFGRTVILHPECPWCKKEREASLRVATATTNTSVMTTTPKSRSTIDTYIPEGDETFKPHGSYGYSASVVNVHSFPDAFDKDGRCIHHDEIQLRKPTWFGVGEMTVLLQECPTCKDFWREELDLILRIRSCFED